MYPSRQLDSLLRSHWLIDLTFAVTLFRDVISFQAVGFWRGFLYLALEYLSISRVSL